MKDFSSKAFFELDYQDSNLDKQNQNLLCYHYTIVQTYALSVKKRCKDKSMPRNIQIFRGLFSYLLLICLLFGYNQVVILLSALHKQIFFIQKVSRSNHLVEGFQLLFIKRNAATLHQFTHLTFGGKNGCIICEQIDSFHTGRHSIL